MSANLISTFFNGDTTVNSITSLEQTMLRLYRGHDGIGLGGFFSGNISAPSVLAGSSIVVNCSLYEFTVAESINVLNTDGTVTAIASAADGHYYIIAVVGADSKCTLYARLCSAVNVSGNSQYLGWYISGTQNRVIGGFRKAGTVYDRKWRYQLSGWCNELPDYTYRVYCDGIDAKLRLSEDNIVIYSNTTPAQYAESSTVIVDSITTAYPCLLYITTNAAYYGDNTSCKAGMGRYVVTLLDAAGNAICDMGTTSITDFGVTSCALVLHPGKYRITQNTVLSTRVVTTTSPGSHSNSIPVTHSTTYTSGLHLNSVTIDLRNRLGAPLGKY